MGDVVVPAGSESWESPRGRLRVWLPAPRIIALEFRGHLSEEFAPHIIGPIDRLIARRAGGGARISIFNDWRQMSGYDTPARVRLTEWAGRIRPHVGGVHLLVGSKLVAMGISVANIALGGFLTAYADDAAWQAALARAVEESLREG